ncbi:hypothetical protein [Acetivibrio clariflavus]|uniref:hypothetical protein n=1 Tax=Acetivibrio clariflavus TaxID=288965 RepID=UPI00047F51C0|nr:hypothetical protein [Acetivibrio clariflavus]
MNTQRNKIFNKILSAIFIVNIIIVIIAAVLIAVKEIRSIEELLMSVVNILIVIAAVFLFVIGHELSHFIFGIIYKCRVKSIGILFFEIGIENGRLYFKFNKNLKNIIGMCYCYPDDNTTYWQFVFSYGVGILFDAIVIIIMTGIMVFTDARNSKQFIFAYIPCLIFFINDLIPVNSPVISDMYVLWSSIKNKVFVQDLFNITYIEGVHQYRTRPRLIPNKYYIVKSKDLKKINNGLYTLYLLRLILLLLDSNEHNVFYDDCKRIIKENESEIMENSIPEFKALYIIYLIHVEKDYDRALELWEGIKDIDEKTIELLIVELMVKYVANQDNEYLKTKLFKDLNFDEERGTFYTYEDLINKYALEKNL